MIKTNPEIKQRLKTKQRIFSSAEILTLAIACAIATAFVYYAVAQAQSVPIYTKADTSISLENDEDSSPKGIQESKKVTKKVVKIITAKVTGYNTVPEQTDSTPCIASSGENICGRKDVVACPRALKSGTIVEIHGKEYKCLDILAEKYDNRFDISCDKDFKCPYEVTGVTSVKIISYEIN